MPRNPTTITAAAGEHFVAALLAAKGYTVALTRGGTPGTDLLVANRSGTKTISIQVKTSNWARREYKKKKENNHYEWPIPWGCDQIDNENYWYAFVDLRSWPDGEDFPEVFFVPSSTVASQVRYEKENKWSRSFFEIREGEVQKYREERGLIQRILGPPNG
ncbi:MAG: restriction endonuclease [bacterium]|nr:restriction endonuclease [bacterium]